MATRKKAKNSGPDKTWLAHQVDIANNTSDTARVEYALKHFHDIRKAKAYEDDPTKDVSRTPSFTGWKLIKDWDEVDLIRIATALLEVNWNGKKAVSSAFLISDKVLNLLGIKNYAWNEKWGIGRICLPALAYSGVYYLHREGRGRNNPYCIYRTKGEKIKREPRLPDCMSSN